MTTRRAASFTYSTLAADQGQIVEIAYACDFESGLLLRRAIDRSEPDATPFYAQAEIDFDAATTFEPQNGTLPDITGPWHSCF
jgi:hypothetical protein